MSRSRHVALIIAATSIVWLSGCAELVILFGPDGFFPPSGGVLGDAAPAGSTAVGVDPGTGGLQGAGNTVPVTTQPAPIAPASYRVTLLDDLLEQSAGAGMIIQTDLDRDGVTDFASISSESQVVLLHLRDPQTMRFLQLTVGGGAPLAFMQRIAAADFDGDGNTDLAVAVHDTGFTPLQCAQKVGMIVLLFAPSDPREQLDWVVVPLPNSIPPMNHHDTLSITDLAIADFDGQNGPDIAFAANLGCPGPPPIRFINLFLNPGGAAARDGSMWGVPRNGRAPFVHIEASDLSRLFAADLDGDGSPDLVANSPNAKSFNIRWLRNPGGAAIDPDPAADLPPWETRIIGQQDLAADALAVGDIDGDGAIDVASATDTQSLVQWFQNPGHDRVVRQTFPWLVYNVGALPPPGGMINQLQIVDLNDDGRLDAWVGASGTIFAFFPRDGESFLDYWTPTTIVSTNPPATIGFPAFLDLNGDGKTDMIVPFDRPGLSQDQFATLAQE